MLVHNEQFIIQYARYEHKSNTFILPGVLISP